MQFKEAISSRMLELCTQNNITPNKLAEISLVPPTTMQSLIANRVTNPSSYVIYKVCKALNIKLKDFYDSDLFDQEFDN